MITPTETLEILAQMEDEMGHNPLSVLAGMHLASSFCADGVDPCEIEKLAIETAVLVKEQRP